MVRIKASRLGWISFRSEVDGDWKIINCISENQPQVANQTVTV